MHGDATERLIALAGSEHVSGYTRTTKSGKAQRVGAYWRSPGRMSAAQIISEVAHLTTLLAQGKGENRHKNRLAALKHERAMREQRGEWKPETAPRTTDTPITDRKAKSGQTNVADEKNGLARLIAANQREADLAETIAKQFEEENPSSTEGCDICGSSDHTTSSHKNDLTDVRAHRASLKPSRGKSGQTNVADEMNATQRLAYAAYRSNGFTPNQAKMAAIHGGKKYGFGRRS